METSWRFRFRDEGMGDFTESDVSSAGHVSADSTSNDDDDDDDESNVESMTGKGIKRLCSELLELKKASDDDFHRSVYANRSAFLRIFEEVRDLESEFFEIKRHVSTQRKLVQDLLNGLHEEVLSEVSINSIIEEDFDPDPRPLGKLEAHAANIIEALDILLLERRYDEALLLLEMEPVKLKMIQAEEDTIPEVLEDYNSSLSEMRKGLIDQLTLEAEHPRISASEFQKTLSGLCRLGETHRAKVLFFQFYCTRLANATNDLHVMKLVFPGVHVRECVKSVFSIISQAAQSFVLLYGETSSCSELIKWVYKETESFLRQLITYLQSIREESSRLSVVAEVVQHVISFCSLLESQEIFLEPILVKLIRPYIETVLEMHVNHLKVVIRGFTAVDNWVLAKFILEGLKGCQLPSEVASEKPEYYALTVSAWKLVTLMLALVEDISPFVNLQIENSILKGLADMFIEYVEILEWSIAADKNVSEMENSIVESPPTLSQQLAMSTSLSTLVIQLFPNIGRCLFPGHRHLDAEHLQGLSECCLCKEFQSWIFTVEEAANSFRHQFCERLVLKVVSLGEAGQKLISKTDIDVPDKSTGLQDPMPSDIVQVFYFQLRHLKRLALEIFVEVDLVAEDLLEILIQIFLEWLLDNFDSWLVIDKSSALHLSATLKQFAFDVHFLVEVARHGGYLSESVVQLSLALMSRVQAACLGAGMDVDNLKLDEEWITNAAKSVMDTLQQTENMDETAYLVLPEFSDWKRLSNTENASSKETAAISLEQGNFIESKDGQVTNAENLSSPDDYSSEETSTSTHKGKVVDMETITHGGYSAKIALSYSDSSSNAIGGSNDF